MEAIRRSRDAPEKASSFVRRKSRALPSTGTEMVFVISRIFQISYCSVTVVAKSV